MASVSILIILYNRHPEWTSSKLVLEKENPFAVMKIDDTLVLDNLKVIPWDYLTR